MVPLAAKVDASGQKQLPHANRVGSQYGAGSPKSDQLFSSPAGLPLTRQLLCAHDALDSRPQDVPTDAADDVSSVASSHAPSSGECVPRDALGDSELTRWTRMKNRPVGSWKLSDGERVLGTQADVNQGHTISQRLRKLKEIPVELIPLGNRIPTSFKGSANTH
ncbi:hypothetical protein CDD80_90 [Ophiocordyceps camponoti-rufipedis]|uniref:Uncharacterized protein n=1 Tax=Ophiocordyceps camponoti-rufipedis TaxID=2004952 RepID=A0A2C5ZA47_9HYPO|nr:hypothetical protein CDD80_90 [Ophiocordyceps camponoti-rufipedis]